MGTIIKCRILELWARLMQPVTAFVAHSSGDWELALLIHQVQQRIWSLSARQTQQSSWTQLNRFAKSSYPSLSNTSVFTRQLLLKSPPLKEKGGFLPAVTCTITFWGDGQEKEVLVPYLRVSQSLGMAPSVHVHCYTKHSFHFILFSPLYF